MSVKLFTRIKHLIAKDKVVCYYRCSSKSRKEHLRQKFLCEKYAADNGYTIDNEFSEIKSGNVGLNERNVMLDCITYCIKNKVPIILISEIDRFSRNVQTANDILDMVRPFGIKFLFVEFGLDTSKGKKEIEKLISHVEMSHYELKKIKYRLDTGMEKYVKSGGRVGRKPGYRKSKDEKRAQYANVLHYLFEEDRYSLRRIAEKCNVSVNTIRKLKEEFKDEYSTVD